MIIISPLLSLYPPHVSSFPHTSWSLWFLWIWNVLPHWLITLPRTPSPSPLATHLPINWLLLKLSSSNTSPWRPYLPDPYSPSVPPCPLLQLSEVDVPCSGLLQFSLYPSITVLCIVIDLTLSSTHLSSLKAGALIPLLIPTPPTAWN